jgi:hypothetical protein
MSKSGVNRNIIGRGWGERGGGGREKEGEVEKEEDGGDGKGSQ